MLTKNRIKQLLSLRDSKERHQQGLFLVEGPKWVEEILCSSLVTEEVFGTSEWLDTNAGRLRDGIIPSTTITTDELRKISSQVNPNSVIALVRIPEKELSYEVNGLSLMLDGIQDPGNLGTIIRIADWFGIACIICSPDTVDAYNPKVVQATMGSLIRVPVFYHDLPEFLGKTAKTVPVYGALLDGEDITGHQLSSDAIIIIGNESKGISKSVLPFINNKIRIPAYPPLSYPGNKAESLNASVAAALICYEFRRKMM